MRVVFYYESIALGGQQTQTLNVIRHLEADGWSTAWAYLDGSALFDEIGAVCALHRIPVSLGPSEWRRAPWKLLVIAWRLARICRAHRADAVISGSGVGSIVAGLAARATSIAHLRLVGGDLEQVEPTLFRHYRWLQVDRLVDAYLAWPAVFEQLASKGVSRSKFVEVTNAVDTELFCPIGRSERATVRAELGFEDGDLVIGWIGRIAENMQIGNTVKVCQSLLACGVVKFKLLIVGGGPWMPVLRERLTNSGLAGLTVLTDWVPYKDVPRLVNAMDVVPLLEADPQGGSIVREAMSCGRVAVSVDGASGSQARFMPAGSAVLVPPLDFVGECAAVIERLAADRVELEQIGRCAREHAVKNMSFRTQVETIKRAVIRVLA